MNFGDFPGFKAFKGAPREFLGIAEGCRRASADFQRSFRKVPRCFTMLEEVLGFFGGISMVAKETQPD